MAFSTSITSTYAGKASVKYFLPAIFEGTTLSVIPSENVKTDIDYKYVLRSMSGANLVQTGTTCTFNSNGSATIAESVVEPKPHYLNISLCLDDYAQTDWEDTLEDGELPKDFQEAVIKLGQDSIKQDIEKKIWKGNLTGTTNSTVLSGFDGYLQILKKNGSASRQSGTTITTSNVAAEFFKLINKAPDAVKEKANSDKVIFVSPSVMFIYKQSQANLLAGTTVGDKPADFMGIEVIQADLPTNTMVHALKSNLHVISNVELSSAKISLINLVKTTGDRKVNLSFNYKFAVGITNQSQTVVYGH